MESLPNPPTLLSPQDTSFIFLTKFLSTNTLFTYTQNSFSFNKAFLSLMEHTPNNHIKHIMNSPLLKPHPNFNPQRYHDTFIYTLVINFYSFHTKNIPSLLTSSLNKSSLILSKLYIQCNYPFTLYMSILKSLMLLSTVKVDLNKNISHKNYNIKNYFLYETAFNILLNTFITYNNTNNSNNNTYYTKQNENNLNEFIQYFNNTFIQNNMTNVLLILNYSNNNFNLFTLMSSLLTKTFPSSSNELTHSILTLLINIYKYNFNYISCMKQCIHLSMNAFINFNSINTPIQNKRNLHLINFPISFITSLMKHELLANNNESKIINDMFYFNNKRSCVFMEDYFDFSYSYYIISTVLYPKDNKDMYTILQFDKKDETEKIEVAIIKNDINVINSINKKKVYYPNDNDLNNQNDKNKKRYKLIIRICYKKKPQNDILIDTCVYIEPYEMNVFIIHFDKDKVEIYCKANTNTYKNKSTFTKNVVNIKAFTKNKMKLLIGNNSISCYNSNSTNTTFSGCIGPIICFKELDEDKLKHLFSLNGYYERLLYGDKYDFTYEMTYHNNNKRFNDALSYFTSNPIQIENILLFISPLSFQFIPYEDYYINHTHIKTNEISKHIFKKSNYARIRSTKNLSFKSKFGICGEHFHQKFAYIKHALSTYEFLRYNGIQFITLCLEFHFQFLLHYENNIQLYKETFYEQM